jgi:hypothetical protein
MDTIMAAIDGTVSLTFDTSGNGLRMISGLRDSAKMAALLQDEEYHRMQKKAAEFGDRGEATIEPKAFEHRGVSVMKLTTEYDVPELNPFAKDGKAAVLYAVANDAMLTTSFGSNDGDMKRAIDDVLDQKSQRGPLPGGALAVATIRLTDLATFFSELSGGRMDAGDDLPAEVGVTIRKNGKALAISVRTK